ncbi:MAG: hypothetical protein R3E78_16110 [Burkholderiaceae bacterium]
MSRLKIVAPDQRQDTARANFECNPALQSLAQQLWPHSAWHQREWLRAIGVVRRSRNGWLLERSSGRVA